MVHGGFTHEALRPYVLYEFLPGHDTIAVRDKISEDIEYLRLNLTRCPSTPEFIELGVEDVVAKKILHGHPPHHNCRR
jgi:hypothetical protein